MAIDWLGQSEQGMQQPMNRCGVKEILPAYNVRNALQGIIQRHRQMIARRRIGARQYDVAPAPWRGSDDAAFAVRAGAFLSPRQRLIWTVRWQRRIKR